MGFTINPENIDPDHINTIPTLDPGYYHFQVESWDDNEAKEFLEFKMTIIGTEPGKESLIGKTHTENIFYSEKQRKWAEKKALALAVAVGQFTKEQVRDWTSKNLAMHPNFDEMTGLTFVGKLSKGKDKDGNESKYVNLNFDYYELNSEEAKNVTLNQTVINNPGTVIGASGGIQF